MAGTGEGAAAAIIQLDLASPTPKYQQIVEQIKALIVSGMLPPGAPLPSVRQLAGDLGINVNTVVASYRALDSEHLVLLRRGSRAIIHPRLARPMAPSPDSLTRMRRSSSTCVLRPCCWASVRTPCACWPLRSSAQSIPIERRH